MSRPPRSMCSWVCSSRKRTLVVSVSALVLLSIPVFLLKPTHPNVRNAHKDSSDRDVTSQRYDRPLYRFKAKKLENSTQSKSQSQSQSHSLSQLPSQAHSFSNSQSQSLSHSRSQGQPVSNLHSQSQSHSQSGSDYTHVKKYIRRNGTALCSPVNETSGGHIEADVTTFPSQEELEESLSRNLLLGGHFKPQSCRSRQKVALIVPCRFCTEHLKIFLKHMHPFLQRQNLDYHVVVVQQAEGEPFNRALLFNIGYYKMDKLHNVDCFIFQDVDLLPLDDRIAYQCQDQPVHLNRLVDTQSKDLLDNYVFGGVVALTPEMMTTVNGFSNLFYELGGEDRDMSYRLRSHGYKIARYSKEVSRYAKMKHGQDDEVDRDKVNRQVQSAKDRIQEDGLNSLVFHLLEFQPLPLYTWIYIKPNRSLSWEDFDAN